MLRSLHMKLVMLMVLLILSLMTVVGAFLINSVVAFYIQDFYSQMSTVFGDQEIVSDLRTAADGETDGAGALKTVLNAYAGQLGVDTRNRNFYILDGEGTSVLASSNGESGASGLSYTGNLMTAIESGQVGDESNAAADYMDVAIPIQRGGSDYIIYILDNKATVSNLNNQLLPADHGGAAVRSGDLSAAVLPPLQDHDHSHPAADGGSHAGGRGGLRP